MLYRILTLALALTFTQKLSAETWSSVLTLFDDGSVLVSKKRANFTNQRKISDFSGKQDRREPLERTAFRKFMQETGYKSFPNIKLQHLLKAPVANFYEPVTGNNYNAYILRVHGKKPSITEIMSNVKKAKKSLGSKANIETTGLMYVPAKDLLTASFSSLPSYVPAYRNGPLVPLNFYLSGRAEPVDLTLRGILKNPVTQSALLNIVNNKVRAASPKKVAKSNTKKVAVKKKTAPKKVVTKKVATKKVANKKVVAKKLPSKKVVVKKSTSKKIIIKKAAPRKIAVKKPAAKKTRK